MVTAEVAALGVDTDCGPCAGEGIRRLKEARPDLDWEKLVHDAQHHDPDGYYSAYWCVICHPEER